MQMMLNQGDTMETPETVAQLPDTIASATGFEFSVADFGKGATYLGVGVLLGLLAKKYLRLAITSLIVAALLLKGLEIRGILTVDWVGMRQLVGLDATATIESLFNLTIEWFKTQSFIAISAIIGFMIGYKAG
jgi:uncharacterized membrane protein (Fun14 family)